MARHPHPPGHLPRTPAERHARRVLERELADYAAPADRNDLEVLAEETGTVDDEVADILRGQATARLFRAG